MRFPRKIRKDLRLQDNTRSKITSSGLSSILKRKWTIIVLGIVIAVIGFAGVMYFGSQYLRGSNWTRNITLYYSYCDQKYIT